MWSMLLLVIYAAMPATLTAKEQIYYIDYEHPNVTYWNPKYLEYLKITAQRHGRHDPIHYLNFRLKLLTVFGNDIVMTIDVHEFLSNEYRPSMLVLRFKICDFFSDAKYDVFKPYIAKFFNASSCPFPKGEYSFLNFSISNLPKLSTFPVQNGRVFCGFARGSERVAEAYFDAVIKHKFI